MESKKSALKINMSENKVRIASGKLEIVQKAAEETPQKAVVEVWEEAKNYKPPPVPPASTGTNP
jgi:nucleoprotein TPR